MVRLDARELASLGIHRPFDRALAGAGWCLLIACLLPVSHDGDRALFFVDIADTTPEAAAAAAQIFTGLVWIALGRAAIPARAKAIAAIAPLVIFAVSLADAATTRASVLPFFPTPMQACALFFAGAVVFGVAALRTGERALLFAAFACVVLLYLWPAGLLTSISTDFAILLGRVRLASSELESIALASLVCSFFPLLLAAYLAVRAHRPRGTFDLAFFLSLPAGMLLELGLRSSTEYGIDGHLGIAARAALILVAVALAGAYAIEALIASRSDRQATAVITSLSTLCAGAVAIFVHAVSISIDRTPWDPAQPPAWADALYRRVLPRFGDALADEHPLAALEEARAAAMIAAAPSPRLASAISELALELERGLERSPDLRKSIRRINDTARRDRLPFYVDVVIEDRTDVRVLTYRIREVRHLDIDGRDIESLWVERHDDVPVIEQRLGWKPAHDHRALVLLDAVKRRWEDELRPALSGESYNRYTPYRDRLLEEFRRGTGLEDPTTDEARSMALIAQGVEAHETMHVLDEETLIPPREVRASRLSFRSAALEKAATSELSAYLAEIARSPVPTLALADLAALARMEAPRPEAIAGRIVREMLLDDGRIPDNLAARAREAHRSLFGGELAPSLSASFLFSPPVTPKKIPLPT